MASIGGDTNTLLRRFMNRNRRSDLKTGPPGKKATYRPRKQGTVRPYKPSKQKY